MSASSSPGEIPEAIPHNAQADSFQFGGMMLGIRHAVTRHAWVVVLTTLLTTALVLTYIYVWPPTFEARVIIAADSDKDIQRQAFYQGWNIFRKDGLVDEAALMTSPPVLKEVATRLNLRYADVYHPFLSYAIHLWTNSWLGRNWRAFKQWVFGTEANPLAPSPEDVERFKLLKDFEDGVALRQVADANIGLLMVKGSNQRVAEIANTLVDVYLEQRRQRYIDEAQQAYASLSKEAEKAKAELQELDEAMKRFRTDTGSVLLFEKDRVQIGHWYLLRGAITDLQAQIADQENTLRVIDGQLAAESGGIASDRMYRDDALKDQLAKLELALAGTRQTFKPEAPEVRDLQAQIDAAHKALDDSRRPVVVRDSARMRETWEMLHAKRLAVESALAGARASLQTKKAEYEHMSQQLERVPEKMQVNQELERRQRTLEAKYAGINEKLTMAAVSMATARSAPSAMRVVDRAGAPEQPVWPKSKLFVAGAVLAGLVVGTLGALLLTAVFPPVTRWRLSGRGDDLSLFAVVGGDEAYLRGLFGPRKGEA